MTKLPGNYKSRISMSNILRHASRSQGFSTFDKIKNVQLCSFQLTKSEKKKTTTTTGLVVGVVEWKGGRGAFGSGHLRYNYLIKYVCFDKMLFRTVCFYQ